MLWVPVVHPRRMPPRQALAALAVLTALGVATLSSPPAAGAATVLGFSGEIVYSDDEENDVTVSFASGALTITEQNPLATIVADGPECAQQTVSQVICSSPGGIARVEAFLGDTDDTLRMLTAGPAGAEIGLSGERGVDRIIGGPAPEGLVGGPGDDSLSGGGGADSLVGGPADAVDTDADTVDGGDGNDDVNGGAGNDRLLGGAGDDTLEEDSAESNGQDSIAGGPGRDRLDHSRRTGDLLVTLDDRRGDGEEGEQDDVGSDVEDVTGGSGGDIVLGSAGENDLNGRGGDDVLLGAGGRDSRRLGKRHARRRGR